MTETCAHCGALRRAGDEWCPRCLERYEPLPATEPVEPVDAAPSSVGAVREPPPYIVEERAPGVATVPARPPSVPARVAAAVGRYGIAGRVAVSLPFSVVISLGLFQVVRGGRAGLVHLVWVIPVLLVGGWLLADVWERPRS